MSNVIKNNEVDMQPQYWNNICKLQAKQTKKGYEKYGQVLEQNTVLSTDEVITYFQEELIDALMYCEHLKQKLKDVQKLIGGDR